MKMIRRIRVRALAWCVAVVLVVCAVVFLSLSGYLYLARNMPSPRAALVTGGALLVLAGVVIGIAYWVSARRTQRRDRRAELDSIDDIEALLTSRIDPMLRGWIDRHPEGAAAGTLLLGIVAGYSRSARRVLQEFYEHYAESERQRRDRHRDGE